MLVDECGELETVDRLLGTQSASQFDKAQQTSSKPMRNKNGQERKRRPGWLRAPAIWLPGSAGGRLPAPEWSDVPPARSGEASNRTTARPGLTCELPARSDHPERRSRWSRPTVLSLRSLCQISLSRASTGSAGEGSDMGPSRAALRRMESRACTSTFPLGVVGKELSGTNSAGTM